MIYQIQFIAGEDNQRRGVTFLISENDEDKQVTAKINFDKLNETPEKTFRTRFDYWTSGQSNNPKWFHGWDQSQYGGKYKECFVFKCIAHRLYGFLCKPKEDNKSYCLCVLVRYATKNKRETDETDLKYVEERSADLTIRRTIKEFFKDKR